MQGLKCGLCEQQVYMGIIGNPYGSHLVCGNDIGSQLLAHIVLVFQHKTLEG